MHICVAFHRDEMEVRRMAAAQHTRIVSSTGKRTRIRLSAKRRNHDEVRRIVQGLEAQGKVHEVTANLRTGSLVVHHAPGALEGIYASLRDLGVVVASTAGIGIPAGEGHPDTVSGLSDAVADLNRRLGLSESGLMSLRTLIPLGFGVLALGQLMRRGLQIEAAPWYFLAYLSFDSFMRLHPSAKTPAKPQEASTAGGPATS
jgi:hypothetical protein